MNKVKESVRIFRYSLCKFLNFSAKELKMMKHEDPISCIKLLKLYSIIFGIVMISAL